MKKSILIILVTVIIIAGGTLFYLYTYTDIINKKLIPKVESLTLVYSPAYDYEAALEKNKGDTEFIKLQEINIGKKDLEELKKDLKAVKEDESKEKKYTKIGELKINKDYRLIIGEKKGKLISKDNKETNVKIPTSLSSKMNKYIEDNNKKVFETPNYEKGVIKKDGAVINLTNKTNIDIVKEALSYYRINQSDDYLTFDGGFKEILVLNDAMDIYLYSSNNIGYIKTADQAYYVIFPNGLEEIVRTIYEISVK